jgi:hypothetical protein
LICSFRFDSNRTKEDSHSGTRLKSKRIISTRVPRVQRLRLCGGGQAGAVTKAAKQLGYKPPKRPGETNKKVNDVVGIVVPDITTRLHESLKGMMKVMRQNDIPVSSAIRTKAQAGIQSLQTLRRQKVASHQHAGLQRGGVHR